MSWKKNEAEHAVDRKKTAVAIASGRKTAWEIETENSFVPVNAKIEVDFESFLKRRSRLHAKRAS